MPELRRTSALVLSLLLAGCRVAGGSQAQTAPGRAPLCAVFFSPHGGCTEEVVKELAAAKERVLVQAYSFTSQPIARALAEAHRRGVKVAVILDKSQRREHYAAAGLLTRAGVPVEIDAAHAIAHNKVMVIDRKTVLTGSFNFTESAEERNAENLLVVQDAALAAQYAKNWEAHRAHSTPYGGDTP